MQVWRLGWGLCVAALAAAGSANGARAQQAYYSYQRGPATAYSAAPDPALMAPWPAPSQAYARGGATNPAPWPAPSQAYARVPRPVYVEATPPAPAQVYAPAARVALADPVMETARPQGGVAPQFRRAEVAYSGPYAPGTLVIDTPSRHLYLVQPGGRAIRYGVGVGRPGFEWAGVKHVSRKAEWPGWTPPPEMRKRRPDLPAHMEGGEGNPLGARALYLGSSLYRIHGTNEPHTIGQNVSSGCIRMMNADVIDLYNRVPVGAKVVVM